jgi:hypothetical protein
MLPLFSMNAEAMLPQLCIETNESGYLLSYHQSCERDAELERDYYMPGTQEELEALFGVYSATEYKDAVVIDMTANIEGELSARCQDGDIRMLDKYLGHMSTSFALINDFRDLEFSEEFFLHFADDFDRWILEMEDLVRENSNFTRESLHLPYTVKYIDGLYSGIRCLSDRGSIFEEYCKCCLDASYKQSPEYKALYAEIEKIFTEGITLETK